MTENLRIVLPQWQGGMNPNYKMGARILRAIVPDSKRTQTIEIPVSDEKASLNGVDAGKTLLRQMDDTFNVLEKKGPKRVITLGGDCSISEAPFDYLNGKYDDLGIIWLDAHPDISTSKDTHHIHEMVVANLLGKGAPDFNEQVKNKINHEQLLFAGLQFDQLRPMDSMVKELKIPYITPNKLKDDSSMIRTWITEHNFKHIAVHLDLDVLDPDDFRSILPAQPHLDQNKFGAAIGSMHLDQVIDLLQNVNNFSELVGLSIAEHMPWDAINLHNGLKKLSIFE